MPETDRTTSTDAQDTGTRQKPVSLERIACPLCGSSDLTLVVITPDPLGHVPGDFSVDRCRQCGHQFMNPRPTIRSLPDCYPPHYGPHQSAPSVSPRPLHQIGTLPSPGSTESAAGNPEQGQRAPGAAARPWYLRLLPLRKVPGLRRFWYWLMDDCSQPLLSPSDVRSIGLSSVRHGQTSTASPSIAAQPAERQTATSASTGPHALEIGCATGRYLQRLQQAGWTVTGIEPGASPARMALAAGLNVHPGTLEDCPLDDRTFDLAVAWMVLEHVPDPGNTLRRLHQLLKPGGTLQFSVPNAGCWEPRVFGRHWYVWEPPRHLHYFTPSSIRMLLTQCGFSDIVIVHQRTLLNVVGSLGQCLHSRWPRCRMAAWLRRYPDNPALFGQLLLAPAAHLLAMLGQGGRLTVSARCHKLPPGESHSTNRGSAEAASGPAPSDPERWPQESTMKPPFNSGDSQ